MVQPARSRSFVLVMVMILLQLAIVSCSRPSSAAPTDPGAGNPAPAEESGPQWVGRYSTSHRIEDLAPGFREKVEAFSGALRDAGATVTVVSTRRSAEQAYLMHYAWLIARGDPRQQNAKLDPANVPPMQGVNVAWVHHDAAGQPDVPASIQAAEQMVEAYGMAYVAVLDSLHIQGKAIDWHITWNGTLQIKDANGKTVAIDSLPRNSEGNRDLWQVGATYGVIKLATDPPHWSENGH